MTPIYLVYCPSSTLFTPKAFATEDEAKRAAENHARYYVRTKFVVFKAISSHVVDNLKVKMERYE